MCGGRAAYKVDPARCTTKTQGVNSVTDVGICKTATPCNVLCPVNIDGECEVHPVMVLLVCCSYWRREIFSEMKVGAL